MIGEVPHLSDHFVRDCDCVSPLGQVEQDHEPCRAFHEGADLAAAILSEDQVSFPVPGNRTVFHFGGSFGDHDHARDLPGAMTMLLLAGTLPGHPLCPATAQAPSQLTTQLTLALHIDRPVDRFV